MLTNVIPCTCVWDAGASPNCVPTRSVGTRCAAGFVESFPPNSLLSHAEPAEDAVQNIFGVNRANDAAEFFQGETDFSGDEFFSGLLLEQLPGVSQTFQSRDQRFPAPRRRAGDDFARGTAEREYCLPQIRA